MKKLLIIFVILVIVVLAGVIFILKPFKLGLSRNQTPTQQQKDAAVFTIDITPAGFSTGAVTVTKGTTILLKNSTSLEVELTGKDIIKIKPEETYSLKTVTPGQFSYTNKQNKQILLLIIQ